MNSEWLTQIERSFEFLIIWLRADGDDAAAYDDGDDTVAYDGGDDADAYDDGDDAAAYDDGDDADAPNYPVLLHPEKPKQEVAVCPTVVDVRLKIDQ